MATKCYLWELCNLKDPEEGDLLVKVAGMSLVPGPIETLEIKVNDETEEGRKIIADLQKKGFIEKK